MTSYEICLNKLITTYLPKTCNAFYGYDTGMLTMSEIKTSYEIN